MDLLCTLDDPAILEERALYICEEVWDGGPFLTYAQRKGRLRLVPPHLRHIMATGSETDEPYSELLYPAPRGDVESFCQTWLYFGLLAEVLGFNSLATAQPSGPEAHVGRDIAALHSDSMIEENGVRYLTGARAIQSVPQILEAVRQAPNLPQRAQHLAECMTFTFSFLNSIQPPFNQTIKFSIAALGELLTFVLRNALTTSSMTGPVPVMGYPWYRGYLPVGGELEITMLSRGWCISEVEKIRVLYQGLNTRHFLSRLKSPTPYRDHSACSRNSCTAFQLDPKIYRPAHTHEDCSCNHINVDIEIVMDILVRTQTFPVLNVNLGDGDLQNLVISVEEHQPDIPYVALSHVGSPLWNHETLPASLY